MKLIALLFCLLSFSYLDAQKASVGTPLTLVAYVGMENPLEVSYPGVPQKDIFLKAHTGCSLVHGYPDFRIIPAAGNNTCSLIVGIKKGSLVKWVDTIEIPVRPFPVGEAKLCGFGNGDFQLSQILSCNGLSYYNKVYIKGIETNSSIKSFRIMMLQKNMVTDMRVMNSIIPQSIKDSLAQLKAGDIIMIDAIKAEVFGMEIYLPPLTIKLTEDYNPIEKTVEDLSEKNFKLDSLNDSTYFYESYYPDGKIYQQGKVLINTNFRFYGYQFAFDKQWQPIFNQPYEPHLYKVHDGYFPVSKWLIFDSTGRQKMEINYIIILARPENNKQEKGEGNFQNFLIVPDGECVLYKTDGSIENKIYYNKGEVR